MVSEPAKIAPAPLALPAPGEAGFQARVAVGPGPTSDEHWMDLFVPGTSDSERTSCEHGVESLLSFWERTGPGARLQRPCGVEPLPDVMQRGAPHTLLVHEDTSSAPFLAIEHIVGGYPALPADAELPELSVKITGYARQGSAAECQASIERMLQHSADTARAAASASTEWLQQQLAENEHAREVSCAQADEARGRCAPLRKGASAAAACEGDPAALACKQAKRKSEKFMRCEVELKSSERSCANATKLLEVLRSQGVGEPAAPEPVKASCIPG
jgi:hypothetical protein